MQAAEKVCHSFRFGNERQALTKRPPDRRKSGRRSIVDLAAERRQDERAVEQPMNDFGQEGL